MNQQIGRVCRRGMAFGSICGTLLLVGCAASEPGDIAEQMPSEPPAESAEAAETQADSMLSDYLSRLEQSAGTADTLSLDWEQEQPQAIIAARPEGIPANPISVPMNEPGLEEPDVAEVTPEPESEGEAEPDDGLAAGTGAPAEPTLDEQIDDAVWALRGLLRDSGQRDLSPLGAMLRVALLESVRPGVFQAAYGPLEEAAGSAGLTDDEQAVLESTVELATSLHAEFEEGIVDLDRVVDAIDRASTELGSLRFLSIDDARLCLRVDNFGVYREVERFEDRYKFIAGRTHPVIVYCELDHFTRQPSDRDGVSGYVVNIRQALELYRIGTEEARDSENTLVWQMDAQPVVDFSRRALRDFFIVQVIELPPNLSVGSYRMKIIATDVATGQQVEKGIEFDMVANANALRGPGHLNSRGAREPGLDHYDPNR